MRVAHVFPSKPVDNGNFLMYADVMFGDDSGDGIFTVKGWKLLRGKEGDLWVAPPSQKRGENWEDLVFFKKDSEAVTELKAQIRNEVIAAYNTAKAKADAGPGAPAPKSSQPPTGDLYQDDLGF